MKLITVTMPLSEYKELAKMKEMFDKKVDIFYLTNYWGDTNTTVYYNKDALPKIQERIIKILEEYEGKLYEENKPPISEKGKSWIKEMFHIK